MKCVRNTISGQIKRSSDENAQLIVEVLPGKGEWVYCAKSEWKALRTAPVVQVVHTEEQTREIARKQDKKKYSNDRKNYKKG